ncbi:MAG: DUF1573 domain-containing protein [Paludibacter sp.]|nr:MAG: DUF1573 domain-containing protein [Paludibacter sp.]
MKIKVILVLWLAAAGLQTLYGQKAAEMLVFRERIYDFGSIREKNGKVSHTFTFENEGTAPVVIGEVYSGCGCIAHAYSRKPVLPGEYGSITITYNPSFRPGFFSREIVVYSNNRKNVSRIWVKGHVIPFTHPVEEDYPYHFGDGLYLSLKVLAFGALAPGQSRQIKLRYANDTDHPMTLHFELEDATQQIAFTNPGKLVPGQRGELVFSCSGLTGMRGSRSTAIYPVINGKRGRQWLEARISGIDR